jgi:hypothetical protein
MKKWLLLLAFAAVAGGCNASDLRPWQSGDMATGDRQRVFQAAREVLGKHFEIAEASFPRAMIETRPQVFEKSRAGTLADFRGAGGRWRRTVHFEMEPGEMAVIARVAVHLEREATAAAEAMIEAQESPDDRQVPRTGPRYQKPASKPSPQVWMEIGYDAGLARELLAEIAGRVRQLESGERLPPGQSPQDAAEETRRLGTELNR